MDIFLAGATGVIGNPCVRILVRRGHRVFATTRRAERASELWAQGAIPVIVDVFQAAALGAALRAIKPAAVLDLLTDLSLLREPDKLEEALRRNAELRRTGSANLVAAARQAGVERMVSQSIAWFYREGGEPHKEDEPLDLDAPGPRGMSVAAVAALERSVLDTPGLRGCVLRFGLFYGPRTGNADAGTPGYPVHVHVEAAAWAAVMALEKEAVGVYNVTEPGAYASTDKARQGLGWRESLRA